MRSVLKIGHKDFGCWIKDFNEIGSENWTQRFGFWIKDFIEIGSESFNQNCFLQNLRHFGFRIHIQNETYS